MSSKILAAGPGHDVDLGFEFDKTITPTTALILNDAYDIQQARGEGADGVRERVRHRQVAGQYSLPYLQAHVKDVGLPGFMANLIPLVEFTWSSPASSPSSQGATWMAAPGVLWMADWGKIGVKMTIPLNHAAGTNLGAVGLVHFFLDDLFPDSIGKPIFN